MRRKGKTVTPSRRLQAKGEMSILQTNTKTPMKKIHPSSYPDLMIKMLSGNKKIIFSRLQLYAWAYLCMDVTLLVLDTPTGFIFQMISISGLVSCP